MKATQAEKKFIEQLQVLAKTWPKSLWLYSASGAFCVMKNGPDGKPVMNGSGGYDQTAVLATIDIPNDGGDF